MTKAKNAADDLEAKWVNLSQTHEEVVERINKGRFSFEEFERLRDDKAILTTQCQSLQKENHIAEKASKKWRNECEKLR